MKLYGSMASPYVARVVMCARAKGIDLEPQPAPGGSIKSPEYLRMNPLGRMPVLEVDGQFLAESAVICEYLEDAYPERSLRPVNPLDRARARLLARVLDLNVMTHMGPLYRQLNPATRNAAQTAALVSALNASLNHLDHFMGPGPYAVGSTLSLADCAMLPGMALLNLLIIPAFGLKKPTEMLPKLREWWAQMGEDPLCVQILQEWTTAYQEYKKLPRG